MVRFTQIVDWYDGRLDGAAAQEVQRAIDAGDERVWRTVRWLQTFNAAAASLPLSSPPPIVRQNLRQAFSNWATGRAVDSSSPRHVVAALVFDSREPAARTGTRSGAGDGTYHLAFGGEDVDVLVDVIPLGDDRVRVEAQVVPADPQTSSVFGGAIVARGETFRTAGGDEMGQFSFDSVPDDLAELIAENDDLHVTVRLDSMS